MEQHPIQMFLPKQVCGRKSDTMKLAPIVLFVYKRPGHAKQTLESLGNNVLADQSELYIYADGPKSDATPEDIQNINSTKQVIREKQWCKTVTIFESKNNKGLANSIIAGVTDIVNKYGKIIVIEEDVLLSPYFLKFMNDALETYKNNQKVLSIGSWNYFITSQKITKNFFLRYPDSIAWGTFDRAWKLFEEDGIVLLNKLKKNKKLLKYLNTDGAMPYFEEMLCKQIDHKIDSWAIRWTGTAALHQMLTFFPRSTLSKHIGFGEGASHEDSDNDYNKHLVLADKSIEVIELPVQESRIAFRAWKLFIFQLQGITSRDRFKKKMIRYIPDFLLKCYRVIKNIFRK